MSRLAAFRRAPSALAMLLAGALCATAAACSCKGASPSPGPAPSSGEVSAAAQKAVPEGWEEGPSALDRTRAARRPVLLYVSSEWCPPCRAMEANLLSGQAFLDATKDLVRVRVDGDSDGAQAVAERFEARAYPTLLLLSADGEELFRAHHAVTLEELSPALAAVRGSGRGFKDALARLDSGSTTAADCALLGAVDWTPASGMALSTDARIAALKKAVERCGESPAPLRAQLAAHLLGTAAIADTVADSVLPGAPVIPMQDALVDSLFQSDDTAWAARALLTTWTRPVVTWLLADDHGPRFAALRDRWLRAAAAIRSRPGASLDMQLFGENPVLDFHSLEHAGAPVPAPLRDEIEALVASADSRARSPAERHAVVPEAAYLLRAVGRPEKARDMLLAEIAKTDAPSYYLTTLSQWALTDGHRDEARRYAHDATEKARGRTSRLQWMVNELALYEGDPADRAQLLALAAPTYALLFAQDDAFLGRNRARADRLAELFAPLHDEPAVKSLVTTYSPRCDALPEESRAPCRAHFAALRGGR